MIDERGAKMRAVASLLRWRGAKPSFVEVMASTPAWGWID